MGSRGITAALVAAAALAAAPAAAALSSGKSYAPAKGKAYHGVSDTGNVDDFFTFADQVGAHPAVLQEFFHWRVPLTTGAFARWAAADTWGVLSLSTATGAGEEVITPQQIAEGRDDRYILRLARTIADAKQTVYLRLMAEMNGHWNAYSAFNADGSQRRNGHSTRWFKRAWRRFALIVRGGPRREINQRLVRMGLPRILRASSQNDPVYEGGPDGIPLPVPEQLPQPRVAMMWVPQSFGSPNVAGNQPVDYWPGGRYVDWVGIDIYSKFASAFDDGKEFFHRYRRWPFVIGEYGPWDNDYSGTFTRSLFDWAEAHNRVKMLIYYRDVTSDNAYNVQHYPGAQEVLRNRLNGPRWLEYAPGVRSIPDPPPTPAPADRPESNPAAPVPPPRGKPITNLSAQLAGKAEVPGPGDPNGKGEAFVAVKVAKRALCWQVSAVRIDEAAAAHVHKGAKGAAGPIKVTLFDRPQPDEIAEGCARDVKRKLLKRIARSPARYYVNVHNADFPEGAIRGQLRPAL